MTHRVQQIMDAAAAACAANATLPPAEVNRVRSLGEDQAELPALTINYGTDSPDDVQDQSDIASAIELQFSSYVVGDSETEVLLALLIQRTEVHKSIMADMTLGLPFLWEILYGGADAPQTKQGERMYGAQTSLWTARYLMDSATPE